ncbi:MAG: hypothetical protein HC895_20755 [Leptolyngbyaceae cyanobacterium SM1_3_5]|nr:hypothetical protein [Leptolyngbyaceae cyanobacterium SM1_3_5]
MEDGDKAKFSARLTKGAYFLRVDTEEGRRESFNIKLKLESGQNNDDDDNDNDDD